MPQDPEVDTLCEGFSLELGRVVIPLRLGNLQGSGLLAVLKVYKAMP